jgi:maleamate amidohydrolase
MNDWQDSTREDYLSKGLASRSGYGRKPALLIIDFSNGFTDPKSPLGGNFDQQLATTASLLTEFRRGRLPVVYTTVAYQPDFRDAGVFIKNYPRCRYWWKDQTWLRSIIELHRNRVNM